MNINIGFLHMVRTLILDFVGLHLDEQAENVAARELKREKESSVRLGLESGTIASKNYLYQGKTTAMKL
jgi:hypothetical protein